MNTAHAANSSLERVRPRGHARIWLGSVVLVLLVMIVYWPTLDNGFVGDDSHDIRDNLAIRSVQGLTDLWTRFGTVMQYYPLTFTSFWAEYQIWGLEPAGYHVVNFSLHAASALLVWWLLARLRVPGAWLAAAIFAVHPIHVESVAWLSERKNLLSLLFALASLLAYFRFAPPDADLAENGDNRPSNITEKPDRRAWFFYVLSLVLFTLSLLSKTATVTLPAVVLVIDWWKRGRVTRRDVAWTLPFFALGLALSIVTIWMEKSYSGASGQEWDAWMGELFSGQNRHIGSTLAARAELSGRALWFYAAKLVWPHPLAVFYPRWNIDPYAAGQYAFPVTMAAVLIALYLARQRIGRGPLSAVLIFAGVLTPVLGFFNINIFRFTFVADHLQYHASIALTALFAAGLAGVVVRWPAPVRWLAPVAAVALLVPLILVARERTRIYHDDVALDLEFVEADPHSWEADHHPGVYFQQQRAFHNLAFAALDRGAFDEARAYFERAIEIKESMARNLPDHAKYYDELAGYHVDVGLLERRRGRRDEAKRSFLEAATIRQRLVAESPATAAYREGLAWCYAHLAYTESADGRVNEALELHGKALQLRQQLARDEPTNVKYQNQVAASCADVGLLMRGLGRGKEAQMALQEAAEIRQSIVREAPRVADYQAALAACFDDLASVEQANGQLPAAEESFRKAVGIRRRLMADAGQFTVIRRVGSQELQVPLTDEPGLIDRHRDALALGQANLGILLTAAGRPDEAESSLRRAIEICELLMRERSVTVHVQQRLAWCLENLALAQRAAGHPSEAEASQARAISIRRRLAADNPESAADQDQLAASLVDAGILQLDRKNATAAANAFRQAIAIRQQLARERPTVSAYQDGLAWCHVDLALAQQLAGNANDATESLRAAVALREQLVQSDPQNAGYRANLAAVLAQCGDALANQSNWSDAEEFYARAVGVDNKAWHTQALLGFLQLAAGHENRYRESCAALIGRIGPDAMPETAAIITLTFMLGPQGNSDAPAVLALAKRAGATDPTGRLAAVVVAAAEYCARRGPDTTAALADALARLKAAPADVRSSSLDVVAQLVGDLLLAGAYRDQQNAQALEKQVTALRATLAESQTLTNRYVGSMPWWTVSCVSSIADRELGLSTSTN